MKNVRIGLGRGLGCGYKNLAPMDAHIHSLSAKGISSYKKYPYMPSEDGVKGFVVKKSSLALNIPINEQIWGNRVLVDFDDDNYLYAGKIVGYGGNEVSVLVDEQVLKPFIARDVKGLIIGEEKLPRDDSQDLDAKGGVTNVKQEFLNFLDKKREEEHKFEKGIFSGKHTFDDPFADVKIYTDKEMATELNSDESKGWTGAMPYMKPKEKGSNVVALVTYDGAGYDYFSYSGDYPSLRLTEKFQKLLDNKFGKKYVIEDYTNWAFQVYKVK